VSADPAPPAEPDPRPAPAAAGPACGEPGHAHGYLADKDAYLRRLRRIEGQVRGLQRMVAEEQYCIDILTQVAALNSALRAVAVQLLEAHLAHCVAGAGDDAPALRAGLAEASAAITRLLRA
jgi:DNA-binding FrmR family transcriptional regulator